MLRAWLVLVAVALAGCSDAGDADAPGAPSSTSTFTSSDTLSESTSPSSPVPQTLVTPLVFDGATATAACAGYAATGHCQIVAQPRQSWTEFSTLGLTGMPVRIAGNFTWTAATPATADLRVFLFSLSPEGPPVDGVEVQGPSPLAIDVDLSALTPGAGYAMSVHSHTDVATGDAGVIVEPSQEFHADLRVTTVV